MTNYFGTDVDASRTNLVTSRSETRATLWVAGPTGQDGSDVSPSFPLAFPLASVSWAGERLVFDSGSNGLPTVAGLTLSRGQLAEIATNGFSPAGTSDGRTVVFVGVAGGLWKVDSSTGAKVQLLTGDALFPIVTHDDRHVIFVTPRSGTQSPWMVPLEGGTPIPIADTFAGALDVSADGRRLLFFTSDPQNQFKLIVCDLPTCTNRVSLLLPSNYAPVMQRFMPGGRGIAYVDLTLSNIWSLPLDGGEPRQLTNFRDRRIANFAWSRDGKRLAIMRTTSTNDVVLFRGLKE